MEQFGIHDIFGELVVLLLIATIIGALALRFRQPVVIGFILVGILIGPSGVYWIKSKDEIHLFAEMGLALLLFIVGLKLDLRLIRTMGPTALIAGLGQVVVTSGAGYLLAFALGMPPLTALYLAIALALSSTIIIVKLLSDKHETDSLHGRITLGILIVQDLVVVLAMLAVSAFDNPTAAHPAVQVAFILLKGLGLIAGVWVMTFVVFPRMLPILARSAELLVLVSIAWALALALLGEMLGFGKEIGAFIAGVSLASTAYREILGAKLVSLRDFLLLFFFIELGSRLNLAGLGSAIIASSVLALFVLIGKPVLTMIVMGLMGYRRRTGFMVGASLAQISEFSLILIAMGVSAGHLGEGASGLVTLVGLISIGLSSYLIQYAQPLYDRLAPSLKIFERPIVHREDTKAALAVPVDVVLFGLGGYGTSIAAHLQDRGRSVLGVDFDPQAVRGWESRGWTAAFGDAEDPDFAATLPLAQARWVVSAIRDPQINRALAHAVRHAGYAGNLAFTARSRPEGELVIREHTGLLFVPFDDASAQAVDLLFLREEEIARETMDKLIASIHDHYVVCGYGRMGQQIVRDFQRQGMKFVVVEDNPEQLPRLKEQNIPHVIGNASLDEVLIEAGITRARGLIAVASSDEENVFIVLTARGLNQQLHIVARSIREENEDKLRRAGADRVMSPYILGGRRMATAVIRPGVMDFLDLVLHSDAIATEIGHIAVPSGSGCVGQTIQQLGLWQACGVTVLAVQRASDLHANPCPDFLLQEGDELIIMGTQPQIDSAQDYLAAKPVNSSSVSTN
ncbi:MAG: cation:proton antiporter domain-containing protein [Armatimonadota bacterium]